MPNEINTIEGEIWKPIPGYEGRYSVSNMGRIMSHLKRIAVPTGTAYIKDPTTRNILKLHIKEGYLFQGITSDNGYRFHMAVHRAVAYAFIGPPPPDRHIINHKNGIKTDNVVANLEWCTPSENVQHSYDELGRQSLKGEKHGFHKLTEADVIQIRQADKNGYTTKQISQLFDTCESNVRTILRGEAWTHI